ncbi:ATP-dependent DNA helicase Q-like 1 [Branchiostoma floridae]|uniref:ATP-dependent DNA helicase n=1 Tax=Branchiostoma floridae TaxID=7739 RepID=A0A9J7LV85_BRAFL|nr:ATP-dependent DNA helicase Q-like 1 [Branchiostoma floridae]
MAACGENVGKERKNMDSACRASREGRVPCPHKDCLGNGEFYVSGAGLDVHYRARHGSKPDGNTEKAAEKMLHRLCFAEMKEKLLEIEASEQAGEEYTVTSVALTAKITATRPEQAAKKAGIILHAGGFLHSFSSAQPPYPVSVQGKNKEVHYDLWYILKVQDNMRFPAIFCKPTYVKMSLEKHQSQDATANNSTCLPIGETDIEDPLEECLNKVFNLQSFRPGQKDIINAIHTGENTFLVMPTGGGKTLCFTLPALLRKGVAVVIVPLLALGTDILRRYEEKRIPAVFLSHLTAEVTLNTVIHDLNSNTPKTKLLIITPESLVNKPVVWGCVVGLKERGLLEMVVVDEAHCMDQMGHEFRPTYLQLSKLAELKTQIVACTATATPTTKQFIMTHLQMGECRTFHNSVDRRNIQYSVRLKGKTREACHGQVCEVVLDHKEQCGIVYCQTVSDVKDIHYHLQENGIKTVKYHGTGTGQNEQEGRQSLLDWQRGLKDVLVATKAAGAGIDKPDVRFVVHLGCPSSVPDYLQESGRAGRDGRLAEAILFYSPKDKALHVTRIGAIEEETYRAGAVRRLADVINFCETELCRRKVLLEAFGEDTTSYNCNKTCDNCLSLTVAREVVLTTEAANMVRCVSAIRHTVPQPSSSLLARVFLGLGTGQAVKKQKLDELPEFGLGKNSGFNLKICERFIRAMTRAEILEEVLVPKSTTQKFASLHILPGRMAESTIRNEVHVTLFIR